MAFEVHDADSNSLGLCVSPLISRFKHSCRPTAIVTFPLGTQVNKPMKVVALDPKYSGEEVSRGDMFNANSIGNYIILKSGCTLS
jgi:hypothetical protein